MRSLFNLKISIFLLSLFGLTGCLVSETPVLTASNGHATPLKLGAYEMCPVGEGADIDECSQFSVEFDAGGLYQFLKSDEEPAQMRFRRVGRKGYAVQSLDGDDYVYYYGAGDSDGFLMTMMMCGHLPEKTRARLIAREGLSSDDDDFETCTVNNLKGLTGAARAYHRGKTVGDKDDGIVFTIMPLADDVLLEDA